MFSLKQQSKDKDKSGAAAAGGVAPARRLRAGQLRAQKGMFIDYVWLDDIGYSWMATAPWGTGAEQSVAL